MITQFKSERDFTTESKVLLSMSALCDESIFGSGFVISTLGLKSIIVQDSEAMEENHVAVPTLNPNATYRNFTTILDDHPGYFIFKMVFNVPFGLLILIGNAFTIHTIRRTPALRTVTNVFIQSLSCSDILNAFPIITIRFLIFMNDQVWSNALHMLLFTILALSPLLSLYSHAALAFDRYLAVCHPFKYKQIVTKKCAKIMTLAIWIINMVLTISLSAMFWKETRLKHVDFKCVLHLPLILPFPLYYGVLVPQVSIFLSCCIVLYSAIFIKIRIRMHNHHHEALRDHIRPRDDERDRKAAETTAIVLLVLIVCWTPFSLLTGVLDIQMFFTDPLWFALYEISVYLLYANSFINPIIYWFRLRDFKNAYRALIK